MILVSVSRNYVHHGIHLSIYLSLSGHVWILNGLLSSFYVVCFQSQMFVLLDLCFPTGLSPAWICRTACLLLWVNFMGYKRHTNIKDILYCILLQVIMYTLLAIHNLHKSTVMIPLFFLKTEIHLGIIWEQFEKIHIIHKWQISNFQKCIFIFVCVVYLLALPCGYSASAPLHISISLSLFLHFL